MAKASKAPAPPEWADQARQRVEQFESTIAEAVQRIEQAIGLASTDATCSEWLRVAPDRTQKAGAAIAAGLLEHIDEVLRPKGPIVDVERRACGTVKSTSRLEVERMTPTQIVMRGGQRFYRETGLEIAKSRHYTVETNVIARASLEQLEKDFVARGAPGRGGRGEPREAASSPSRPGDHNGGERC